MNQSIDAADGPRWLVLVYRVPPDPSSSRVSVWRDLKRMGALYLQQCVCVVPAHEALRGRFDVVRDRVTKLGGSSNLFSVPMLPENEEASLVAGFRDLISKQYAEIAEECETKFVKEIEFEYFRENFSFAEADEIDNDLEKIRRWFTQVTERDWFDAPGRAEVVAWIERCAELLEGFFATVHAHAAGEAEGPDAADRGGAPPRMGTVKLTGNAARAAAGHGRRRKKLG